MIPKGINQEELELDKLIIRFGTEIAQYIPDKNLQDILKILPEVMNFTVGKSSKFSSTEQLVLEKKKGMIVELLLAIKQAKEK